MSERRDTIVEFTGRRVRAFAIAVGQETAIFFNSGRFGPWREAFPRIMAENLVQMAPQSYSIIGMARENEAEPPFDTILEYTGRDIHEKTIRIGTRIVKFTHHYGEHGPWRALVPAYIAYGYQAYDSRLWHCIGKAEDVLPPVKPEPEIEEVEFHADMRPGSPQLPRPIPEDEEPEFEAEQEETYTSEIIDAQDAEEPLQVEMIESEQNPPQPKRNARKP